MVLLRGKRGIRARPISPVDYHTTRSIPIMGHWEAGRLAAASPALVPDPQYRPAPPPRARTGRPHATAATTGTATPVPPAASIPHPAAPPVRTTTAPTPHSGRAPPARRRPAC